ncbi:MAG: hypothetical protein ABSF29_03950 [Tepidisphaeraceae bacterium]|jgi:hypothetical protein
MSQPPPFLSPQRGAGTEFPVALKKYFPWVQDETLVDRAEYSVDELLFDAREL